MYYPCDLERKNISDMSKKLRESVHLRQKKLANGSYSLYLDIYTNGERTYEFLKLYLIPEQTNADKVLNRKTIAEAQMIRSQREVEITRSQLSHGYFSKQGMLSFFDYATHFASRSNISKARSLTINSVVRHLKKYAGTENLSLSDIDKSWVMGFRSFLEKHSLKVNTRRQYMMILRSMLNLAKEEQLVDDTPFEDMTPLREVKKPPQYLTIDEVQKISQTPCKNEVVKRAFLFSCLTGTRFKDVKRVTWGQIVRFGNYVRIACTPQPSDKAPQYICVSEKAVPLLGDRGGDSDLVFESLPVNKTVNTYLKEWAKSAGLEKKLTFHMARHTFATMLLTLRINPETVQDLLGHRSLYSMQKYAEAIRLQKEEDEEKTGTPDFLAPKALP